MWRDCVKNLLQDLSSALHCILLQCNPLEFELSRNNLLKYVIKSQKLSLFKI